MDSDWDRKSRKHVESNLGHDPDSMYGIIAITESSCPRAMRST